MPPLHPQAMLEAVAPCQADQAAAGRPFYDSSFWSQQQQGGQLYAALSLPALPLPLPLLGQAQHGTPAGRAGRPQAPAHARGAVRKRKGADIAAIGAGAEASKRAKGKNSVPPPTSASERQPTTTTMSLETEVEPMLNGNGAAGLGEGAGVRACTVHDSKRPSRSARRKAAKRRLRRTGVLPYGGEVGAGRREGNGTLILWRHVCGLSGVRGGSR